MKDTNTLVVIKKTTHTRLASLARRRGQTMGDIVSRVIERYLRDLGRAKRRKKT